MLYVLALGRPFFRGCKDSKVWWIVSSPTVGRWWEELSQISSALQLRTEEYRVQLLDILPHTGKGNPDFHYYLLHLVWHNLWQHAPWDRVRTGLRVLPIHDSSCTDHCGEHWGGDACTSVLVCAVWGVPNLGVEVGGCASYVLTQLNPPFPLSDCPGHLAVDPHNSPLHPLQYCLLLLLNHFLLHWDHI